MSEKNQKLVLAILDFLNASIRDGTVKEDDKEGLDVAIQCIGEAFGVDPNDPTQCERLSIKPATLSSLFDVFSRTQSKLKAGASTTPTPPAASSSAPRPSVPSDADKKKAEEHKKEGNARMSSKDFDAAIQSYTKAIALDPSNPVYYSNRAAAYSSKDEHDKAIIDAKKALEVDPSFVKAYSRLGHAYYCLEDYAEAVDAFSEGLKLEPNNANLKSGLANANTRVSSSSTPATRSKPSAGGSSEAGGLPDLSSLASMFGGGGGGDGIPDFSSMMKNPAFLKMAQNVMANGTFQKMMENPTIANLAQSYREGQTPDQEDFLKDPELKALAEEFIGGQGR